MKRIESTSCRKNQAPLSCTYKAMLYPAEMEMKDRLKQARKNVRLKPREVAKRLKIKPQSIYQWESGETGPTRDRLLAVAKIYRVPVEALETSNMPLPEPTPDLTAEFLVELLRLGELLPEAQRTPIIKMLASLVPEDQDPPKPRRRAS